MKVGDAEDKEKTFLMTVLGWRNECWIRIYPTDFPSKHPCRASLMVSMRDFRLSFHIIGKSNSVKSWVQNWADA